MGGKLRLSSTTFEALLPNFPKMSTATISIARQAIVEGRPVREIAEIHDVTRQRIHHIIRQFVIARQEVPQDWERVEVWVPPELAPHIRELAAKARNGLNQEHRRLQRENGDQDDPMLTTIDTPLNQV